MTKSPVPVIPATGYGINEYGRGGLFRKETKWVEVIYTVKGVLFLG
jgi:hypothetical protein